MPIQVEALSLEELEECWQWIQDRRRVLIAQREQQAKLRTERLAVQTVWKKMTAFCDRIKTRLNELAPEERQRILRLLVERVISGEGTLRSAI